MIVAWDKVCVQPFVCTLFNYILAFIELRLFLLAFELYCLPQYMCVHVSAAVTLSAFLCSRWVCSSPLPHPAIFTQVTLLHLSARSSEISDLLTWRRADFVSLKRVTFEAPGILAYISKAGKKSHHLLYEWDFSGWIVRRGLVLEKGRWICSSEFWTSP